MEVSETYLAVRWSTSRGRDTYGYNICSVTDQATSKRYSCKGGGYGTVRATPRVTSSPAPSEPGRLRPARSLEARPGFGCCGFSNRV